jgi:hypothetical protein
MELHGGFEAFLALDERCSAAQQRDSGNARATRQIDFDASSSTTVDRWFDERLSCQIRR